MNDRWMWATAAAAVGAAAIAPDWPWWVGPLAGLVWVVLRRPWLALVAVVLVVGHRAHGSLEGLEAPVPDRVTGVAQLVGDPEPQRFGVQAVLRIDGEVPEELQRPARGAERQPALERVRVRIVRAVRPLGQGDRRRIERCLGGRHPGPPAEVGEDRLPRDPLGLLREETDVGLRRRQLQSALLGVVEAGQQPQQRRLPRAVRTHDPDHVTGCDHQIEVPEQPTGAVTRGEPLHHQLGRHPGERRGQLTASAARTTCRSVS